MVKAIPLYLARSIADLCSQLGSSRRFEQSLTLEQLQTSYNTIDNNAKQHLEVEGDRELAYLTYRRALEYLNLIQHCEEYSHQSKTFQKTYETKQSDCEQILLALQLELEQRYEELIFANDHIEEEEESATAALTYLQEDYERQSSEFPSIRSLLLTTGLPPRQCAVCSDEKSSVNFDEVFSSACQHDHRQICIDCVREYIERIVSDRSITIIRCPEEACDACFEFDTIRKILVDSNTSVNQFENRLSMDYVERMKNFVWCAHGCGWGCQLDISGGPVFTCRRCKQKTCGSHRVKWHAGMTCEEYDHKLNSDQEEVENQTWLKDHTKQCPGCHAPIEKNQGCDHMTCRRCNHEFCWLCRVEWKRIRDQGAQNHARDCPLYPKT